MRGERVERRLAAILAADVAGYSRLMGADEEGTHSRLKAHLTALIEPTIREHRGRVVKTTGDGLLAEFPSVVEAARCAVAMQLGMAERNAEVRQAQRIELRIGINLGDIIIDEGDIFGDGVNVAARLESLAEPGGICVSGIVHDQVRGRLDCIFNDIGDQEVKNIARPVRAFRIPIGESPARAQPEPAPLPLPDKPSVAVLPFANMSSDPEQEFLADGIAEDIVTALSRYPSLFVIARNSCFTYKGRAVDVKQVGRELGVRYVLEGSLRKAGNRIRVTAQLVEAETGNHIWAERFDRDLADIFAVQDEIAGAVTAAIAPAIDEVELRRALRRPPANLDAWAAYQRGLWHFSKANADDNSAAEGFFHRAIDLDPNFSAARTGLYWAYAVAAVIFLTRRAGDTRPLMEASARQAVALDGRDPEARAALGNFLNLSGFHEDALVENERALAISPNLAVAHFSHGCTLIYSTKPKQGLEALHRYLRLDPHGPLLFGGLFMLAVGHYFCREYQEAAEAARRVIRAYRDFFQPYRFLAAALGQLGLEREAREALDKASALLPAQLDMYARNRPPNYRPEDHAHVLEGLRKAGWQG